MVRFRTIRETERPQSHLTEYDLSEEFSIHAMYRFVDVMEIDNSKPGADVKRDMDMHEFVIGAKYMF